ncbi:unnamed protein product [Ixodes hexagonus]
MDKGNHALDLSAMQPDLATLAAGQLRKMGLRAPKPKPVRGNDARQCACFQQAACGVSFGVAIEEQPMVLSQDSGLLVPRFLHMATAYLTVHSSTEGLFRKSGSVARQRELRRTVEAGGRLEDVPAHDVAGLLKQWFRELPEPVFPKPLQTLLLRCQRERGLEAVLLALLVLPTEHVRVLRHTCLFLAQVARNSGRNRMDARNLALVLAPNFFSAPAAHRPPVDPLQSQASLLQLLVEQAPQVGVVPPILQGSAGKGSILPTPKKKIAATLLGNLRNLVPLRRAGAADGPTPSPCTLPTRGPVPLSGSPLELVSLECSPRALPLLKRRGVEPQSPPGLTPCKRTKHQNEVTDENCPPSPVAMINQSATPSPALPERCHSARHSSDSRPGDTRSHFRGRDLTCSNTFTAQWNRSIVRSSFQCSKKGPKETPRWPDLQILPAWGSLRTGGRAFAAGVLLADERFGGRRATPGGLQRVATWNAAGRLRRGRPNTCQSGLPSPLKLSARRRRAPASTAEDRLATSPDSCSSTAAAGESSDATEGSPGQEHSSRAQGHGCQPVPEPIPPCSFTVEAAPGDGVDGPVGGEPASVQPSEPISQEEAGGSSQASSNDSPMEVDWRTPEQVWSTPLPQVPPPRHVKFTEVLNGRKRINFFTASAAFASLPPPECASKRESIIQIRQRNAGMVRNSVLLFDTHPASQCQPTSPYRPRTPTAARTARLSRADTIPGRPPLRETNFATPPTRGSESKPAWLDYEPRDWEMSL